MYQPFITFLASFLIWFMFLGAFVALLKQKKIKAYFFVLFSVVISWIISQVIKGLFFTVRPFKINGFPPLTITNPSDNSFPSGHTTSAFALATAVFLVNKKLGILMFFLAFLVGLGRILSNVHYPIDVWGGIALGIFVPLFLENFFLKKGRKLENFFLKKGRK